MERDDLIINDSYSLNAHHSEEEGVKIRKKIYFVTVILCLITAVEIGIGMAGINRLSASPGTWMAIKWFYVILTLVKAGYIVLVFMHLGDERKNLRWTILAPYIFFVLYLIFIIFMESTYIKDAITSFIGG
jgi:cytochrome c oxidase subunit IV